jgi:hypothetical protein
MKNIIVYFLIFSFLSLCITHNLKGQWVQTSLTSGYANAMMNYGNTIFAGMGNGIYLTTNEGLNWTMVFNISGRSFTSSGTNIFAGTQSSGVYLSTNEGQNWVQVNNGLTANYVRALAVHGTNIFAGTTTAGVFLSTNNGSSWIPVNNGLTYPYVFALFIHDDNLFAGTDNGGAVFKSTNDGASWTISGLLGDFTYAFTSTGTNIFAGTDLHGCYITTNNGASWSQVSNGLPSPFVNSMAAYGSIVFAGTHEGVAYSTNNGSQWYPFNSGLPANSWIYAMAVDSPYIYAGLYSPQKGVWRRLLSDLVPVESETKNVPVKFILRQNYPNPFNPETNIKFELPGSEYVIINVYDVKGELIQTLINRNLNAGHYKIKWNGNDYPSGIYFYEIRAGELIETRKMVLIK